MFICWLRKQLGTFCRGKSRRQFNREQLCKLKVPLGLIRDSYLAVNAGPTVRRLAILTAEAAEVMLVRLFVHRGRPLSRNPKCLRRIKRITLDLSCPVRAASTRICFRRTASAKNDITLPAFFRLLGVFKIVSCSIFPSVFVIV
jgi:hypothetical protein